MPGLQELQMEGSLTCQECHIHMKYPCGCETQKYPHIDFCSVHAEAPQLLAKIIVLRKLLRELLEAFESERGMDDASYLNITKPVKEVLAQDE
jgi:hypothetical protein